MQERCEKKKRRGWLPSVAVSEESENFFERFVLRLWNLLVREYPEDSQEYAEWKERVVV